MARGGAIAVNIITTFDAGDIQKAQRELAKLAKSVEMPGDSLKELGSKFQSAGRSISDVGVGLTKSIGVASAAFIAFGVSSVKAASEAEAAQNRLRQILLTTGGASEQQVEALNKQAKALENLGVVSAGNITIAQSQLATFDLQAETIRKLTPAVLDYVTAEKGAAASADDFKQMTNGLAQALQGNFASLSRTGFVLSETDKSLIKNGTEAERTSSLVKILNSTYKDFNETLRGTTEGRLQVLRNQFNDLQERIGKALLPVMESLMTLIETKLAPAFDKLVKKFEDLTDEQKNALVQFTLFGAAIGPTTILVGNLVGAIGNLITAFGKLVGAAAAARISLIRLTLVGAVILGLIAVIDKLAERFEPVRIAVGLTGAAFRNIFKEIRLLILRADFALTSMLKGALEGFSFGFADTSGLEKRLQNIAKEARKVSNEIDQAMVNVIKNRDTTISAASVAVEALRDQAHAARNSTKATEDDTEKTYLSEEAKKKAAAAAKKLAEKLREQAKAFREISSSFNDFAKSVSQPEQSLEGLLASANSNLALFKSTAADTSIRTDTLIKRLDGLANTIREQLNGALEIAKQRLAEAQAKYKSFADEVSKSIRSILNFGSAMQTAQTRSKEATDRLTESISQQTEKVTQAQDALQDYAQGISRAVSSTLNFGKAFDTATEKGTDFLTELRKQVSGAQTFAIQIRELVARGLSQDALEQVIGAGDTGTAIARQLLSGGAAAITEANDLVVSLQKAANDAGLESANKFYSAGVNSAQEILEGLKKTIIRSTSFLDALNEQAQNAKKFAEKVKQLIALGLSPEALTEVLSAGEEAGMAIADSIIAGGSSVVTQVNSLVQSVQEVADAVGVNAADAFYKSGVDAAQALVQGIIDQINAAAAAIQEAIDRALAGRELGPKTPTKKPKSGTAFEIGIPLQQLQTELAAQVAQNVKIVQRLETATGPKQSALLKENLQIGRIGAESLRTDIRTFPQDQRTGSTVNVTVNAGLGTNGQDVGKDIVEEIIKFQRRSGEFLLENK